MIKLIAWMVAVYALYHLWRGRGSSGRGQLRRSSGKAGRTSRIDRTKVVDAEFTDVEERREPPR